MNKHDKYETIEEIEKGADEVEVVEVEKFNPFHDARGRFSDKNGFASYSANPNTKAGAMAIARSAAAGHGTTANVHRQSYGETIRQNANWIGRGKAGTTASGRQSAGSATLRRIETTAGRGALQAASAVGGSWQYQNQQQGRKTSAGKNPPKAQAAAQQAQQAQQKPTAQQQTKPQAAQQKPQQAQQQAAQQAQQQQQATKTLADNVANVHLGAGDKLAIVPRDSSGRPTTTVKAASDHDQPYIAGKDISQTVDISKVGGSKAFIDKMADVQGWNKAPTVTNDLETFQKAAKQSGVMLIRSVNASSMTGQSAMQVCNSTMSDASSPLGGNGGKWYGSGMYMVGAKTNNASGRALSKQINGSQNHSFAYGNTQMIATVHPKAKIATPNEANILERSWMNLSISKRKKYGDMGAYIASKGYDGAQWHDRSDPYITMYNKSALIFYGGVATS